MNVDPLEWLLPDALPPERAELRRLVQALCVLRADHLRPGERSVEPSWPRARGELEQVARREALRALETLLVAHVGALLPADAFLPLPPAPLALDAAWRLLCLRGELAPPPPGEPLARGARTLLARGLALGAPGPWGTFWSAALEHAEHGRGPRAWSRELARARATRVRPRVLARFVGGLAASELERGAPARALEVLQAHAPLARLEPSLARLAGWCAVLLGRPAAEASAPVGPLPRALFELAAEDPRFAPAFPGTPGAGALRPLALRAPRLELGASVLAFLEGGPDGRARVLQLEGTVRAVDVALAHARAPVAALERAWRHALDAPWPAALGGERTRALVRLALPTSSGSRWLQLEWPHALVPCRERLHELARRFRPSELRLASGPVLGASDDPRAPVLARALRRLRADGLARVAAFEPGTPGRPLFVLGMGEHVERLARGGAPAATALGLVTHTLALGPRELARVHAAGPVERLAAALAPLAPELLWASFRAFERARGRADPWLLPEHLTAVGGPGARGPFWLVGVPGSGRHTRARALLFAAGFDPDEPGRIVAAPAQRPARAGEAWLAEPGLPVPPEGRPVELVPLAQRRTELAALLVHLARAQVPPLVLDDGALAELWRRDWEGFAVLAEVFAALAQRGPRIEVGAVRHALAGLGLAPRARREPVGSDLELALAATRHRSGHANRARAARWLGVGVGRLSVEAGK